MKNISNSLLPSVFHVTLHLKEHKRVIIVGDVHGCDEELGILLDRCKFAHGEDSLVFVGDLVAKGPSSVDVVRRVMRLGALSVRGNHEDNLIKSLRDKSSKFFGSKTYSFGSELTEEEVSWVNDLPYTISIPEINVIVVHAGLESNKSLSDQKLENMIRMRTLDKHGKASKEQPSENLKLWAPSWPGPETVIFGHAAKQGLQQEEFALGIDTSCVYGKNLTAVIFQTNGSRRLFQLPINTIHQQPDES
jgi:hypothetical protein